MRRYSEAAWERAEKVQEVILRAMAKRTTWWQAAEILEISDRSLRRWKQRMIPAYSPQARGRSERRFRTWSGPFRSRPNGWWPKTTRCRSETAAGRSSGRRGEGRWRAAG